MAKMDWENVTHYIDTVGTILKTFSFNKPQEFVRVTTKGNANITYTIGTKTGTLTPGQSVEVSEVISSFTLTAVSGTQTIEVYAKEYGTEKEETTVTTPIYTDGVLTKVEEKDGDFVKASSALTYNGDGTVKTITETINGETVVTTLNYVNGEFSSVTKAVL